MIPLLTFTTYFLGLMTTVVVVSTAFLMFWTFLASLVLLACLVFTGFFATGAWLTISLSYLAYRQIFSVLGVFSGQNQVKVERKAVELKPY